MVKNETNSTGGTGCNTINMSKMEVDALVHVMTGCHIGSAKLPRPSIYALLDIPHNEILGRFAYGGVFSKTHIAKDVIIGELEGEVCDIYDINHDRFIWLTEDTILDVHGRPGFLPWINEDAHTHNYPNCWILRDLGGGRSRFYLITGKNIYPNEELVYSMRDYKEEYANIK